MESSKFGYWLQITANLGLLIGLILVGVQIQQQSQITRTQLENDLNNSFQQQYLTLQGEAPADVLAKAMEHPAEMTAAELLILDAYINKNLDHFLNVKKLADLGVVEHDRWRGYIEFGSQEEETHFTYVFGNQVSQAYWDTARESSGWKFDQEFFQAIDRTIRSVDPNALERWQSKIRDKLAKRLAAD